jgi:hypothetical protein
MKHLPAKPSDFPLRSVFRVAAFCGIAAAATAATAESTSSPEWATQYQRAEWVSAVRIESVGSLINPSLSRAHLVAIQGYRYNASVLEDWKGKQEGRIRFEVDISDCHRLLTVNKEYVVFGHVNSRGHLQSYRCEDLVSLEEATALPGLLDEFRRSSPQLVGQSGG